MRQMHLEVGLSRSGKAGESLRIRHYVRAFYIVNGACYFFTLNYTDICSAACLPYPRTRWMTYDASSYLLPQLNNGTS